VYIHTHRKWKKR